MTTVAAGQADQHHEVIAVKAEPDSAPDDHVVPDVRRRLESDSEADDRASDVKVDESEIGPERRCTSASGAGESEYESVDEGDESPKEPSPHTCPTVATSAASSNHAANPSILTPDSTANDRSTQEPVCTKLDETKNKKTSTTLKSMCWADVSEAADSLDELVNVELEESAEKIGNIIENKPDIIMKNSSSGETNSVTHPTSNRDEEDDDDENYEDIESDGSEGQSSREDVVDSENEEADDDKKKEEEDDDNEDEDDTSEQASKPLDDDEDMRKPQYIPKRGAFYEHDDRLGSDEEAGKVAGDRESVTSDSSQPKSVKPVTISNKRPNPTRMVKDSPVPKPSIDSDRWGHDMFREDEQKPKSRDELLTSYGFDIRSQEAGQPKAVRYNKRGITHVRSNRSWKDDDDQSPHPIRKGNDQTASKGSPDSGAPSSSASRANDKIAMREAHQASERRRYERESKPQQRESVQLDRTGHTSAMRRQEQGNRRMNERPDRRHNDDMPSVHRNSAPRRPFNRDDFPELISNRSADSSQKKLRDEPATAGAWNRNISSSNSSTRRHEHSSDESQERPVVRTQVVYSSSRFTKDNRSPKSDAHHNPYSNNNKAPSNDSNRIKFDRSDRNERNDQQQASGHRMINPQLSRRNDSTNYDDQDVRTERIQRNNRQREYQSDKVSHRQVPRKDADDAVPRVTDPIPDLSSGMRMVSLDTRSTARRPPVAENVQTADSENRPKRYSATRSQQQQPPPPAPLPQASMPCPPPAHVSHHSSAITHQQMPQQVNAPPPPHQYFDPGPQSPPEYYPEADGFAPYPADPSAFMAHHSRYMPSHPVAAAPNALNPAAPLAVMPAAAPAFLPSFTPSLPPSGFPQYPPPQQYHHTMGGPVPGPAPPPGSEMFRGGVTYYDTTQQQPMRSLPPKRPKNIIPILPPPDIDGQLHDLSHQQDAANTGY